MKKIFIANMVGMTALLLTGCTQDLHFAEMERSYEETISAINLDVQDRRVVVKGTDEGSLLFKYQDNEKEIFGFELDGETLDISLNIEKEFSDFFGTQADVSFRTFEIYVPSDYSLSLNIVTSNEYVLVDGISVDALTVSSNNGDITIANLSSMGDIALSTKNADIKGNIIGSYDDYAIDVDIKKGDTNLPSSKDSGSKKLSISNNNGDVFIDIEKSTDL